MIKALSVPIPCLEADNQATEERGENARLSSFVGAMALGDLVKSTLGPKVCRVPGRSSRDLIKAGHEQDPP